MIDKTGVIVVLVIALIIAVWVLITRLFYNKNIEELEEIKKDDEFDELSKFDNIDENNLESNIKNDYMISQNDSYYEEENNSNKKIVISTKNAFSIGVLFGLGLMVSQIIMMIIIIVVVTMFGFSFLS